MSDMDDPHPGFIIVDTEGSGLFDYKRPADDEGQPRMCSLALIYADAGLNVEREYHVFIRPDGWEIGAEASAINKLTNEYLNEHGIPIAEALNEYMSAIDNGRIFVSHNSQHDAKQLRAELRRAGMNDRFEQTPTICTMRALTDICKIPPRSGRGGYKWPSLSEACVFFHLENMGDHSAINDARACLELLRQLKKLGQMPEARVHYAKDRS